MSMQKLNLYYNAEPAFLSPLEHGEAFITEDGHAVDLDLGNYERLVDETLPGECCCTTGKIHRRLLERELRGDFHGMTIQAIPHVANEIKSYIEGAAECSGAQISIVDIGGTVGDMEASVYLEAIRQMRLERSDPCDPEHGRGPAVQAAPGAGKGGAGPRGAFRAAFGERRT